MSNNKNRKVFSGSINSKIQIERNFVIKYFDREDEIDKYQRECCFYKYCKDLQITSIPHLIHYNDSESWIKIEFINGNIVNNFSGGYLNALVCFLKSINKKELKYDIIAAEAVLGYNDISNHLNARITNLDNESKKYLPEKFSYKLSEVLNFLANKNDEDLPFLLSPSDIGIHNTISFEDKFFFFDFEYAGLDSPVKVVYDAILHPANHIDQRNHEMRVNQLFKSLGFDEFRFDGCTYKTFALWWVLRLINSVSDKVITIRLGKKTLLESEVDGYIAARLQLVDKFWSIVNA